MSASLVGSEMCIRDRRPARPSAVPLSLAWPRKSPARPCGGSAGPSARAPVSYTHLTLPTICSV
eukprot:9783309-Alexandrium_andersonii.AAC.1